jgi:hypothetical protein
LESDIGYTLKVVDVKKYTDIANHPFYEHLTKEQLDLIGDNKFEVIRLEKIK